MACAIIVIPAVIMIAVVVSVVAISVSVPVIIVCGVRWRGGRPEQRDSGEEGQKDLHGGGPEQRRGQRARGRIDIHSRVFSEG
jgi:hypothetical protein